MLKIPSRSTNESNMILSKKMFKMVGESVHPYRTQTLVLKQSRVLPLNKTALCALPYRFAVPYIILALILYFVIGAHKDSCQTKSKAFLKS